MKVSWALFLLAILSVRFTSSAEYPEGVVEVQYQSAADDSKQPALFWNPESDSEPVPLLVALHSWSGDYRQTGSQVSLANWCQQQKWAFIHPNFRGPNWTPQALGSDLVVGDIISAVDYAKSKASIDEKRIYCIGVSGGGHASLLMAARAPEIWAGVSAWCGISDIAEWHRQCECTKFERYTRHIEKVLGGRPEDHSEDAALRSPVHWLKKNRVKLPALDIWHGINDGRSGSVPFTHSLNAWNAAVDDRAAIDDAFIDKAYQTRVFPPAENPNVGDRKVRYKKESGKIRVSIFDGRHEILPEPALNWLAVQTKGERPKWNAAPVARLKVNQTESGQ